MPSATKPCPSCRKPASREFAPFCSARCKDRDLLQWLGDGYRIPGPAVDPEAEVLGVDRGADEG
ncbi:MAG: DNA gyrase inhibitor YacG [Sphingomicrobium sp.]